MPYRVHLPYFDAHRLKATRNPSQTSVCLKTTEKISQQSTKAPEQEQSALDETSFVESVDRRHLPGIERHQTDGYEPAMERQATKEEIPFEKRVKSRKPYIRKHLRREVNKVELDGFHKRAKRVPKDMPFEDAYHKYTLGNFFRESRETDKDIELLFNKVNRKLRRTLNKEQDPGNLQKPESASVDIRIAASVDYQPSESIDNQPSASDNFQSSESIVAKLSASIDALRVLEQSESEKSKFGGTTRNRKKKKKRNADADFLSVVPLQCQEGSLEYRVRCRGGHEPFTKFRVLCDPELGEKGEGVLNRNAKVDYLLITSMLAEKV
ncbi:hypothetical protein DY000_02040076 [Brassica cretica]|uniref:Plus3 domain-containing protein n=1 Tax=Brassica cretica TaxID=69181 RepID=A0ABQ7BB02_BRACR|nr:hypothetical protein DY000_02040076 [Brassica cretica]